MANLISSALCILIILFFSSGGSNVNATDLAAASPQKSEPCYTWLGVCGTGTEAEKNQVCKKRCTAYFHKEHDGFCAKFEGTTGLCFCPVDCDSA